MTRLLTSWWLLAILIVAAVLYAVSADAGERTLEQINRDINRYWAQQRFESHQRVEEYYLQQQLEALRQIEQNTREAK
jgi:hypothetical protein